MKVRDIIVQEFERLKNECLCYPEINISGYTREDLFVDAVIYLIDIDTINSYDELKLNVIKRMNVVKKCKEQDLYIRKEIPISNAIYRKTKSKEKEDE